MGDGPAVARRYADFFFDDTCPTRFRPGTAMAVCELIRDGADYRLTGLPPHFPFPGGSFANGGGMRIWPLGFAFRNASGSELRRGVEEAIRSSHVHPESIDGAVAVAFAVGFAAKQKAGERTSKFDPIALLQGVQALMETPVFQNHLRALCKQLP